MVKGEEKEIFPAIRICGEKSKYITPVYNRKISRKMCKNQLYGQGSFKDKWETWKEELK